MYLRQMLLALQNFWLPRTEYLRLVYCNLFKTTKVHHHWIKNMCLTKKFISLGEEEEADIYEHNPIRRGK